MEVLCKAPWALWYQDRKGKNNRDREGKGSKHSGCLGTSRGRLGMRETVNVALEGWGSGLGRDREGDYSWTSPSDP